METQNHVRAPSDAAMAERCANKRRDDAREDGHVHEGWGKRDPHQPYPYEDPLNARREKGRGGRRGGRMPSPSPSKEFLLEGEGCGFDRDPFRYVSISFERRYR